MEGTVFQTGDASAWLNISQAHANQLLSRLAELELPKSFRIKEARHMISFIRSIKRIKLVLDNFERLIT